MDLNVRVDAAIDAALGSRIVGCVVLVRQGGQEIYARAAGLADREYNEPMLRGGVFRLASCTKPIVAAAVLRMVDLGLISLDDPVTRFLPGFTPRSPDGTVSPILIRQLLSHSSGLTYGGGGDYARGLSGPSISLDVNMRRLAAEPLVFAPGTGWEYGMSIDVLGAVIAAVNGSDVAAAVARYVTGPLGMSDTMFGVSDVARLVHPYADGTPPRRMREPEVVVGEDGSETVFSFARIFDRTAPQSGGAGMAGTADDLMRLMEALRGDFLSPGLKEAAFGNQIGDLPRRDKDAGKRFGFLGAVVVDPALAGTAMPAGAVDWGGAWGHNWVIDRASETSLVVCTNTAFEGCNGPFREEVAAAVFG
ncbi:MAG: serine hydrolase domain-containing protein [Paracoccaceae bacterium]